MPALTQARRSAQFQKHAVVKVTSWDGVIEYQSRVHPWEDSFLGYSREGSVELVEDYRPIEVAP